MGISDYQRGVISAQKLLAQVPANTASVMVNVPVNAETIIVTASGFMSRPTAECKGTGTLYRFAGVNHANSNWITSAPTWIFDVSYAVDPQVTITLSSAPTQPWYVYADAATRVVWNGATYTSQRGMPYMVSVPPDFIASDHPPNELKCVGQGLLASGTLLAAAGPGSRYRLFEVFIAPYAGTGVAYVQDSVNSTIYCSMGNTMPGRMSFLPSGLPMGTNAALSAIVGSGVTEAIFIASYSFENV